MASVLRNVYNIWKAEKTSLTVSEAVKLTSDIIAATHGGEVVAVPDEEASRLAEEETTHQPQMWYDVNGDLISRSPLF